MSSIARIFEDFRGYFVCDEDLEYLDARGTAYPTKAQAMRAAYIAGYTYGIGSGTYKPKQTAALTSMITVSDSERYEHTRAKSYR